MRVTIVHVLTTKHTTMQHNSDQRISLKIDIPERLIAIAAGALLIGNALGKRKISMLQAAAGGFLVYKGMRGYRHSKEDADYVKTHPRNINIRAQVTVKQPIEEVYAFWRNLENLPRFMKHIDKVSATNDAGTQWNFSTSGVTGLLEWDAEIVKEEKNRLLGWHSLPGSSIENSGKVVFEPQGENVTEIHIVISYKAPFGNAGEKIARWINPLLEDMIREDIEAYKHYAEHISLQQHPQTLNKQ
jgi:uncharacterized membrane protein